jgi:hypothetical protein
MMNGAEHRMQTPKQKRVIKMLTFSRFHVLIGGCMMEYVYLMDFNGLSFLLPLSPLSPCLRTDKETQLMRNEMKTILAANANYHKSLCSR